MGIGNWFSHKNKSHKADVPFGDVVPEEFGLGEDQTEGEEEDGKCSRQEARVQLNILVTREAAMSLRLTAKSYKSPIFVAGEHALCSGLAQMAEIVDDPKQYNKMVDHLVKNHLLGTEIRDSVDIRQLGVNRKKYTRRYLYVNVDFTLLRLLSDCARALRTTIKELDEFHHSGQTFTLPLVKKMLLQLLSEILRVLDRFSGAVKTPPGMVPDKPGVRSQPQDGTQSSSIDPADDSSKDSHGDSGRVGINVVEENGEFRDLPSRGRRNDE